MSRPFGFSRLVWPALLLALAIAALHYQSLIQAPGNFPGREGATVLLFFTSAWMLSRLLALVLDQAQRRRRAYPRLLRDLVAALLFVVALFASISLFVGQRAIGALAGSGLLLAVIGFAIRNVVADTLSGIALGIEGPFRIGDWIDIDTIARGRAIEIGWRTTRVITKDSTYLILPNSQISRQRITNFSAPRQEYRSQVLITLDHRLSVDHACQLLLDGLQEARFIQKDPAPDIKLACLKEEGVEYAVRYWLPKHDLEIECRDEVLSLIAKALQKLEISYPQRRHELVLQDGEPLKSSANADEIERIFSGGKSLSPKSG